MTSSVRKKILPLLLSEISNPYVYNLLISAALNCICCYGLLLEVYENSLEHDILLTAWLTQAITLICTTLEV